jgi:hypothetical protein
MTTSSVLFTATQYRLSTIPRTSQQHTHRCLSFCMYLHTRREAECMLVEPLCRLLESKPELAVRALLPKEWQRTSTTCFGTPIGPRHSDGKQCACASTDTVTSWTNG